MRPKTRAEKQKKKAPKTKWVSFEIDYDVFLDRHHRFEEVAGTGRLMGWPGNGETWRYDIFTNCIMRDVRYPDRGMVLHDRVRDKVVVSASSTATAVLLKMVTGK